MKINDLNKNLISWVNQQNVEFIFVVFSNGFHHQYDYNLNYRNNTQRKVFVLDKVKCIEPPFNN